MIDTQLLVNMERTLLSSILFDNSIFEELQIKADDFYHLGHQKCFSFMQELHYEQLPIDESFLEKKYKANKLDETILVEILSSTPISNIIAYQDEIKENSKKRKLLKIAPLVQKLSSDTEVTAADGLDTVQKELNAIDNELDRVRTTADIVKDFEIKMKLAQEQNGPIGLKTSISYLNNLIGAFEPGKTTVIGARPSMGKTSLMCNFVNDFLDISINKDGAVLVDSLEMQAEDILKRLIACKNHESLSDLKRGVVKNLVKYQNSLRFYAANKNFILHDIKGLTFKQLAAKARKVFRTAQKEDRPIKAWLIDHVGKVKILTPNPFQKRNEIAEGTQLLQNICDEFGVHLFILTQLNREITNRKQNRPQLSDIKETGTLEEDADIVIFPHRESYYKRSDRNQKEEDVNPAELIIPKNRDGQSGTVNTYFNGPYNLFGNKDIPVEVVFENSAENSQAKTYQDEEQIEVPNIF
ncbi:DnaB-like helicase C-terminal domain-containing protein [Arcobacter roscoffensis]|uniref:DNA 5'-3' helicase n=1 Tax=Arcobacter roscoffensis TaxID=2961520 RepID=A0ABY5DZM9_9BACT|nr:DnaB-like helicase C-terminal domain-containing protein [Arcobacter roscoffensis]UTJ05404.1 hypothetical protein NJU99_08995 [Arcobacter roscoffensis]